MGRSVFIFVFEGKQIRLRRALASVLTILTIVICFSFFQVLIVEGEIELKILALLFGGISFGLFGYSLRECTPKELGFSAEGWKKQVAYGALSGFGLFMAFRIFRLLLFPTEEFLTLRFANFAVIPIILVIVISEEFFFRSYSITALGRSIDKRASYVISALLFVLYHQTALFGFLVGAQSSDLFFDYEHMAILFSGGILLSYSFSWKRSLIMPTAVHFVWNMLVFAGTPVESLPVFP